MCSKNVLLENTAALPDACSSVSEDRLETSGKNSGPFISKHDEVRPAYFSRKRLLTDEPNNQSNCRQFKQNP